jgi:hypothetical protein
MNDHNPAGEVRPQQERHFLDEADGIYTYRRQVGFPAAVVWEA